MNLSSLFPPTIVARLLDDLGAIADAARRLPELESAVLQRVDAMQRELTAVRSAVAPLAEQLDALAGRVAPIAEISAVRAAVEPLSAQLDELTERVGPIQEITAVRAAVEPLRGQLDELSARVAPIKEISQVRAGIEPLDEDMRSVRHSVDELEPLIREVVVHLESLRAELGPLGDLADKIPGVG
jgi:chromosome segregation ATPase